MMQFLMGFQFLNSVSVPELLEEWDGGGWDGGRDGLDVGVDVGEFLVGHNLAAVWRHVAWTGIADVGSKGRKGQPRLGQAWAGEPALSNGSVTLVTAVTHEKAFAV